MSADATVELSGGAAGSPASPRGQGVAIVAAAFGQNIILTTVSTFILVYLVEYVKLSTTGIAVASTIIGVAKVLDALSDPVMGSIIDQTRTRWGKLRPFILFSAAPVALLTGLMFSVPEISEPGQVVFFGVCYVLWGFAYTACDVPLWGLIGSAFPDPMVRTRVVSRVRAFGAISLGLATLGIPLLAGVLTFGPKPTAGGWTFAVFATCVPGMALYVLAFFFSRERASGLKPRVPIRTLFATLLRNTPLLMVLIGSIVGFGRFVVQAGGATFVVLAYGDQNLFELVGAAIIVGLVIASFLTPVMLRFTTGRNLAIISSFVSAVLYVGMYLVGYENIALVVLFIFLTGLALGVFSVVQATLIADAVDDVERRTGIRNDGISFATLTFVSKIMTALALLAFSWFLVAVGYHAGVHVTGTMKQVTYVSFTLLPAASSALSAIPFFFYRLGGRTAKAARADTGAPVG